MQNAILNSAVLAACGALCLVMAVALVIYGGFSKRWCTISAKIIRRELAAITVDDRSLKYKLVRRESTYIRNIIYEYSVDGGSYRGRNIYILGFRPFGGKTTEKFLVANGGFEEGAAIQIFIDQRHPERSVIVRGIPFSMVFVLVAIGLVAFVFVLLPTALLSEHVGAAVNGLLIGLALGCILFSFLFYKSRSASLA